MATETTTTPVEGAPAPAPEVDDRFQNSVSVDNWEGDAKPEEPEGPDNDGLAAADAGQAPPEEEGQAPTTVEIEHDGKKYAVPKALQGAFLMQADYTRKTQSVAEAARQLEQARQALDAERDAGLKADEAERDAHGRVYSLRQQLQQWDGVNWDLLEQRDAENGTNETASAMRRYTMLRDAVANAETDLSTKINERQAREQTETQRRQAFEVEDDARLIREGYQQLTSKIADWPTVAPKVVEFGQTRFGFSPQELGAVRDPRMFEVLHLAYLGAQASAQSQNTQRIQRQQQAQPAPTIQTRAPPVRDRERMSTEEWMKQRRKEVAKARSQR
jgi:hypothetical protein